MDLCLFMHMPNMNIKHQTLMNHKYQFNGPLFIHAHAQQEHQTSNINES